MATVLPFTDNTLTGPGNAAELGVITPQQLQESHDQFLRLKEQFKRDASASEKWRKQAKAWFALRDGDQWDAEALRRMTEEQRAALTFNRINAVINIVCGIQISNRQEVYVYPRSEGDAEVSEIGTEGVKWFDDRCQAETEESRAFRDVLTCGVGCTETRMDYLDDPDGKGYRERIFPMSMFWDASASKRNLADAKRVWRVKVIELDEAMDLFPEVDPADFDADWTGLTVEGLTEQIDDTVRDYRKDNRQGKTDFTRPVRLVQAQWWERDHRFYVTGPDGQEFEVPKEKMRLYRGLSQYQIRRVPFKRYRYAIIGRSVLQQGDLDPGKGFTFRFITGQYDEAKGSWYGLVKAMEDPQKWQNKTVSNIVHLLSTMGKGGLLYESDAFVDPEKAKRDWSKPNPAIELNRGAFGGGANGAPPKFAEKPVGQLPPGLDALLEFSKRSIYECAGVPFELLAQDVSDQLSGVQEYERKRAGITMLADYFDSLRLYQIQQAELTFEFLRAFHAGQLIRIVSKEQEQYVPFALEEDVQTYDFVIDDSPTSPNQKERTWQLLLPLIPVMVQLQAPAEMWSVVLRFSPLPAALVEKLIGAQEESGEEDEEERQQRELLMRQVMAEIAKTESEARENLAQAQKAVSGAHLDQARAADLGYRQSLDTITELHEMDVQRQAGPSRTRVVDIQ